MGEPATGAPRRRLRSELWPWWVARTRWTLQRFGLTPAKALLRIANGSAPRVVCVSVPKSGTHLLERALCLHPALYRKLARTVSEDNLSRWTDLEHLVGRMRPGQVVMTHLPFRSEYPSALSRARVRGLFMVRDPRDVAVSLVFYAMRRRDHRLHDAIVALPDTRHRLELVIAGDRKLGLPSIRDRLDAFRGWKDAGMLTVRFEDLVGPRGGGDPRAQIQTIRGILAHLGLRAEPEDARAIASRLFSSESPTFRQGSIGQWQGFFDEDVTALFRETAGEASAALGY